MIGIHLYGEIYWFDFPHTLESQEMLLCRLKREALKRSLHGFLEGLLNKGKEDLLKYKADKTLEQHNEEIYLKFQEYLLRRHGIEPPRCFGSEVFFEQFRRKLDGHDDIGMRIADPL